MLASYSQIACMLEYTAQKRSFGISSELTLGFRQSSGSQVKLKEDPSLKSLICCSSHLFISGKRSRYDMHDPYQQTRQCHCWLPAASTPFAVFLSAACLRACLEASAAFRYCNSFCLQDSGKSHVCLHSVGTLSIILDSQCGSNGAWGHRKLMYA